MSFWKGGSTESAQIPAFSSPRLSSTISSKDLTFPSLSQTSSKTNLKNPVPAKLSQAQDSSLLQDESQKPVPANLPKAHKTQASSKTLLKLVPAKPHSPLISKIRFKSYTFLLLLPGSSKQFYLDIRYVNSIRSISSNEKHSLQRLISRKWLGGKHVREAKPQD